MSPSNPTVTYALRSDVTSETELNALAAVYKFVLFDSQSSKGGSHDLTGQFTKECTTRPDKKGKENADLHGD